MGSGAGPDFALRRPTFKPFTIHPHYSPVQCTPFPRKTWKNMLERLYFSHIRLLIRSHPEMPFWATFNESI
jgi:hypothetical protein